MQKNKLKSAANFTPLRFGLLCVAILCCMGLLLVRVGWLQIVSPDNLVKQEDMRSLREEPIDVQRGMISDREGRPLAVSVPVSAIWIDPQTTLAKGASDMARAGRPWRKLYISTLASWLIACRRILTRAFSISRAR